MTTSRSFSLTFFAGLLLVVTSLQPVLYAQAQDTSAEATINALQTQVATLQVQMPTTSSTPTSNLDAELLLYEADWSQGMDGWKETGGWKFAAGMLLSDGSDDNSSQLIVAPYRPDGINYVVEAEIQWVSANLNSGSHCEDPSFGIVTRADGQGAYWSGVHLHYNESFFGTSEPLIKARIGDQRELTHCGFDVPIAEQEEYLLDREWHTYRVEVRGNTITLLVDGSVVLETLDNRHLAPGQIGLWSVLAQISVRSFKVYSL